MSAYAAAGELTTITATLGDTGILILEIFGGAPGADETSNDAANINVFTGVDLTRFLLPFCSPFCAHFAPPFCSIVGHIPPFSARIGPIVRDLIKCFSTASSDEAVRVLVLRSADADFFLAHYDVAAIAPAVGAISGNCQRSSVEFSLIFR